MNRFEILTIFISPYQVMPDLFFYRDPEEVEREEAAKDAEVIIPSKLGFEC